MKVQRNCFVPKDSVIIKEGELLKIGQRTSTMRARYYILRDHALFIYKNREWKFPSNVIPLRGFYITQIIGEKSSDYYGFVISHENKLVKPKELYHKN